MTETSVRLVSNGQDEIGGDATSIRAGMFGEMVKLAAPVLRAYHSDLFHDALWIAEKVMGPIEFDWLVREMGTHIGETAGIAPRASGDIMYRVTLKVERGTWSVTFTPSA